MKLDAGEIEQLVTETEKKRRDWAHWADQWEQDWYGIRYDDNRENKRELEGIETVVSPDPFNIVQLLLRFVAGEQRVEVPSLSTKEDDDDRSEIMEEWLVAFDQESNRQVGRNHVNDMTTQSGVLGRGMSRVLWLGDLHKKHKITDRLPILRETVDPRNCGIGRGAFGVSYGYHKYDTTRSYIEDMYPNYEFKDAMRDGRKVSGMVEKKWTVIDYYYKHQGSVWHSVVIDHEFAKPPVKTDYPDVPYIEHLADGGPFNNELGRSMSILHPIHELWKMKCDLMSKVATGLMYHFDPAIVFKGLIDESQAQQFGPGARISIGKEEEITAFRAEPNVPMAQALLQMVQQGIDQATFPGVVHGESGGVQAGFAINSLNQQARSRVNVIRQNIETGMEAINQQILGLIEAHMPDEGVEVYGRSARGDRGKPLKLTKKIIKGNYANQVSLLPEQPMDDTQRILAWNTLVQNGIVSKDLMRNRVVNVAVPRDEETRVALESALQMPEMQQKVMLRAIQASYEQDDWELMVQGTPLQQVWETEKQYLEQKKMEAEQAKEQRAMEKQQREMQEMMANMPPLPPEMMGPPGMPPMPPGMMGDPLQMPPGLEAMGGPPQMGGGSMPPGPMPPDMGVQPQGLPGMPPQAAAQMTPDMLGLGGPGVPPGAFDQLMGGQPPSEEELLRQITGGMNPLG